MLSNVCISESSSFSDMGHTYAFERIHYSVVNEFMIRHFPKAIAVAAIYLVSIHAGQRFMKNRPAYELRKMLLLWNITLAMYSLFGFSRVFPEMSRVFGQYGLHAAVCELHNADHTNVMVLWCAVLAMSKVVELGDTAFVVTRKAPLLFLHWYHHVATLLFVWYSVVLVNSLGRWFMVNNFFVHSLMYSYYALKVLGVKVSVKVSMAITTLQLLQMVAGIAMSVYAYRMKANGVRCCTDDKIIFSAWAMYMSYFVLFLNFFVKSYYIKGARSRKAEKNTIQQKAE